MDGRPCSKVACVADAVTTLTYVYADSMAVLGPLSQKAEPHSYDLCVKHSERLSAPQGWQVIRHVMLGGGARSGDVVGGSVGGDVLGAGA